MKFPPITEIIRRRFQSDWQPAIADSLVPTIVLESDRRENAFLEGIPYFVAQRAETKTNSTITRLAVQLLNPEGSTILAIIENIFGLSAFESDNSPTSNLTLRRADTALTSLHLVSGVIDTRWDADIGANLRSQCQLRSQQQDNTDLGDLLLLRTFYNFDSYASGVTTHTQGWSVPCCPIILAPGSGVLVQLHNTVGSGASNDTTLIANFCWRERPMSNWERQAIPG